MENFVLLHSEKAEDGTLTGVFSGKQSMRVGIRHSEEAMLLDSSVDSGVINNHISVSSSKNASEHFPHQLLVHHALNRAGIKNYSVTVTAYGSMDSQEVMKGILLAFNSMMQTQFTIEADEELVRLLANGEVVCQFLA